MAKYAARPELPCPPEVYERNRLCERISDVDVSYVVPLADLPELDTGTTSQVTGEEADYRVSPVTDLTLVREAREHLQTPVAHDETPVAHDETPVEPPPPFEPFLHPEYEGHESIPAPYVHMARFPLTAMGTGRFNNKGDLDLTLRIDSADVEKVLPLYRKRQDGLLFYVDFYALPIADVPEGFKLR